MRPAGHPITRVQGYAEGAQAVEDGSLYVEPHLRPEVIEGYDAEDSSPLFSRVSLRLESAPADKLRRSSVPS